METLPRPFFVGTGSNVIIGGKSSEQTKADLAAGVARVGGFSRRPNYFESYYQATQVLIDQAKDGGNLDDLGMPAFYLQRHSLELLLKSALSLLHSIDDLQKRVADGGFQPDLIERERLVNKHSHRKLLDLLCAKAADLHLPPPPPEIESLVQRFMAIEKTETWSRYSSSRERGKDCINHLEEEVVIPLVDLQAALADTASKMAFRDLDGQAYENILFVEWDTWNNRLQNLQS